MSTDPADETEVAAAAQALVAGLRRHRVTLATAESLTGGWVGASVTTVPGASDVYVGGVVTYSTRLKTDLLGVPPELVDDHGVVSAECARAMAAEVRLRLGADIGVSTTGVAGPDRQEGKPAGLVYIGVADHGAAAVQELRLAGDRDAVRRGAVAAALSAAQAAATRRVEGSSLTS